MPSCALTPEIVTKVLSVTVAVAVLVAAVYLPSTAAVLAVMVITVPTAVPAGILKPSPVRACSAPLPIR